MPHLTVKIVKSAKYQGDATKKSTYTLWDDNPRGLGLRISLAGKKSWILKQRIPGMGNKQRMIKLGDYPTMDLDQARNEAICKLAGISSSSFIDQKQEDIVERQSLKSICEIFIKNHAKFHNKTWREDERIFKRYVFNSSLADRCAEDISVIDIQTLHQRMANSPTQANRVLERLRAVYNKAAKWGLIPRNHLNPCVDVNRFRETSRDKFVKPNELPLLLEAIQAYPDPVLSGFFEFLIYTGLRKGEALRLRWDDVDLAAKTIRVVDTKNHQPHTLPMNNLALEVLKRLPRIVRNEHVFPSTTSKSGHLESPKKAWDIIRRQVGMPELRIHDLRRTHGSILAIAGVSLLTIGKALNHKSQSATLIYSRLHEDPVVQAEELFEKTVLESIRRQKVEQNQDSLPF